MANHTMSAEPGHLQITGFVGQAFRTPPADHPIYALIGRASAAWSRLEHALDEIIWAQFPETPRGMVACLTGQIMGTGPRILTLLALAEQQRWSDATKKEIKEFSAHLHSPSERRNRAIHDAWHVNVEAEEAAQFRAYPKSDRRFGIYASTASGLEALISETTELIQRANRLGETIGAERAS